MSLFKDVLSDEESLFTDEFVLDMDYLPDLLPYRENQQKYLAEVLKPLFSGRSGKTIFVHGGPGIGKTSCIRFVFKELKEETDSVKPILINCWKYPTTNAVLSQIASQLGAVTVRHKNNEELWLKIERELKRFKAAAIAFDEIDRAQEFDFLYEIAENIKPLTTFMIANDSAFLSNLDARIRSRLTTESLEFRPYKRSETEGILGERTKAAFVSGVWADEAFQLVVDRTQQREDIRAGIFLLRESGRNAEREASRKIKTEHVMQAAQKMADFELNDRLSEREKAVLDMIKQNPGIESGGLLKLSQLPESTLRRITATLERSGHIIRAESTLGGRGKTMKHYVE